MIFIKVISKYFKQINDTGRSVKIFTYSTLLIMLILCLDITNKPSELFSNQPVKVCLIGSVVLLFIYVLHKRLYQYFKIISANFIDSLALIGLITSSTCSLLWSINEGYSYKTIIGSVLSLILIIIIVIRLFFFY